MACFENVPMFYLQPDSESLTLWRWRGSSHSPQPLSPVSIFAPSLRLMLHSERQTIEKPEVALRNKYIYSTLTFKCQELKRWLVLFAPHTYAKWNHGNPWEDLLSSVCFRSCKRRMLHQSLLLCAPESCVCGSKRVPGTTHPPPQWVGKCAPLWEFSQSSDLGFLLVPVFTVMSLFS